MRKGEDVCRLFLLIIKGNILKHLLVLFLQLKGSLANARQPDDFYKVHVKTKYFISAPKEGGVGVLSRWIPK